MSVSQECPDKLFMYFRKENFKKFLTNHSLKFSDLTKVNDPFELKIDFKKSMIDTGFGIHIIQKVLMIRISNCCKMDKQIILNIMV